MPNANKLESLELRLEYKKGIIKAKDCLNLASIYTSYKALVEYLWRLQGW